LFNPMSRRGRSESVRRTEAGASEPDSGDLDTLRNELRQAQEDNARAQAENARAIALLAAALNVDTTTVTQATAPPLVNPTPRRLAQPQPPSIDAATAQLLAKHVAKVEKFAGTIGPEALTWLMQTKIRLSSSGVPPEGWAKIVISYFEGCASVWAHSLSEPAKTDWDTFVSTFWRQFIPPQTADELLSNMFDRDSTQSFQNMVQRFDTAYELLVSGGQMPPLHDAWKTVMLMHVLDPQVVDTARPFMHQQYSTVVYSQAKSQLSRFASTAKPRQFAARTGPPVGLAMLADADTDEHSLRYLFDKDQVEVMFHALRVVPHKLREQRKRAGECMACGIKGHFARNCPTLNDTMHALHGDLDPVDIVATCAAMQDRFTAAQ
jgi:hypothetical protein